MGYAAEQQLADVANAEWQDYIQRFEPIENALMQQTTYDNPGLFDQDIGAAQQAIATSAVTNQNSQQQLLQRYGESQIGDYATANARLNNLNTQAGMVDAANRITQNLINQNQQIATGSTAITPVPISSSQAGLGTS
jgi:hypothetical protein